MPETVYCEATDLGKKNGLKSGPQPKKLVGRSIMKGFYKVADPKRIDALSGKSANDPLWTAYYQWQTSQNEEHVARYESECAGLKLVKVIYKDGGMDWIGPDDAERKVRKGVASYANQESQHVDDPEIGKPRRRKHEESEAA